MKESRPVNARKAQPILGFLFGCCLLVFVSVLGLTVADLVRSYLTNIDFDPAGWSEVDRSLDGDRTRLHMVDDLCDRYELRGMRADKISALLGPPDDADESGISYWLADAVNGPGSEDNWLYLEMGPSGLVRDHFVAWK